MGENKTLLDPEDAERCSECTCIIFDGRFYRCSLFDCAIIKDTREKNCEL